MHLNVTVCSLASEMLTSHVKKRFIRGIRKCGVLRNGKQNFQNEHERIEFLERSVSIKSHIMRVLKLSLTVSRQAVGRGNPRNIRNEARVEWHGRKCVFN